MAKTQAEIENLAERLLKLPTAQKLTVAVMLLQSGRADVAEHVVETALEDLKARRLLNLQRVPLT